ncbi:MAG: T9SS type A sorting domain-containing protein [Opitutaceae bacterium]|nr:T9SS type A sorting domain-containing protein [Cytophagales bacterium]
MYNSIGQLVLNAGTSLNINVSSLYSGTYLVNIKTVKSSLVKKIVIK